MDSPPRARGSFTDAANRDHLDLWRAAREGDLERCKFLVEVKGMDVNAINMEHNASALYYAALCGHLDVCEYLLAAGARLEAGEFVGERVFYAALNDDLRKFLRKAAQLSIAYRDPYLEDLRKIYESRAALYPDLFIAYDVLEDGEDAPRRRAAPVHRAILRARSPFFARGLNGRWAGKRSLRLRVPHEAEALECVLQWMYTGRLELPAGLLRSCVGLCRALQLPGLKRALRAKVLFNDDGDEGGEDDETGGGIPESERGRTGAGKGPGGRRKILIDPDKEEVVDAFRRLAQEVLSRFAEDADVVICTDDGRSAALHKAVLCGRSEYFRTLFGNPVWTEQQTEQQHPQHPSAAATGDDDDGDGRGAPLPTVRLDISWAAFSHVVHWLYADELLSGPDPATAPSAASAGAAATTSEEEGDDAAPAPALDVPLAVEVLDAATRLMLPGLKNLACNALIAQSDAVDVFSLHELAALYELPRLENHVAECFARELQEAVRRPEFHELVAASAATIKERQATDSIPFLDDVRYAIMRLYTLEAAALEERFALLDEVLARLDLGVAREH